MHVFVHIRSLGEGFGQTPQQAAAPCPTLLRSQQCWVQVQETLTHLGPGHWGSGLCSCARPSLISWVLLGGHPGAMLPRGARSDNSPGPQHSPRSVEGRVNRHRGSSPCPVWDSGVAESPAELPPWTHHCFFWITFPSVV